ncbi:hypothetical protein HDU96_009896 [Phlyctochytrium bullatum]|nr:hypothetical protein HDU96_009896 [Phlyctochytrium bullatum]
MGFVQIARSTPRDQTLARISGSRGTKDKNDGDIDEEEHGVSACSERRLTGQKIFTNDVNEQLRAAEIDMNNLPSNVRHARNVYGADPGQRSQVMMTNEAQGDLARRQHDALEDFPPDDAEGRQALKDNQRHERNKHKKEVSGDLYRNLAGITKYERFMATRKEINASEVVRLQDPNEHFQPSPLVPERGRSVETMDQEHRGRGERFLAATNEDAWEFVGVEASNYEQKVSLRRSRVDPDPLEAPANEEGGAEPALVDAEPVLEAGGNEPMVEEAVVQGPIAEAGGNEPMVEEAVVQGPVAEAGGNEPMVQGGGNGQQPPVLGAPPPPPPRPPYIKHQNQYCKTEVPVQDQNENEDGQGQAAVQVQYELTIGCEQYLESEFRPKQNIRLKQVRPDNIGNPHPDQALYFRPINPPVCANVDVGLVVKDRRAIPNNMDAISSVCSRFCPILCAVPQCGMISRASCACCKKSAPYRQKISFVMSRNAQTMVRTFRRVLCPDDVLDNDFYKFTMQFALFSLSLTDVPVTYRLLDRRGAIKLDPTGYDDLRSLLMGYLTLPFTPSTLAILETALKSADPLHPDDLARYLARLSQPRGPVQIDLSRDPTTGIIQLSYSGTWFDTILLEVPFLSLLSEWANSENTVDGSHTALLASTRSLTEQKCALYAGIPVVEFGTRRRHSRAVHNVVAEVCFKHNIPTSNVLLAASSGMPPRGTCAHEWFMFYEATNRGSSTTPEHIPDALARAIEAWLGVYPSMTALTDVYGTPLFCAAFQRLQPELQQRVHFRCDSGEEEQYLSRLVAFLPASALTAKTIMFSNSLSPSRVTAIHNHYKTSSSVPTPPPRFAFGVGTDFTHDPGLLDGKIGPRADLVIKLAEVRGTVAFKTSDEPGKATIGGRRGRMMDPGDDGTGVEVLAEAIHRDVQTAWTALEDRSAP